MRAQRSRHTLFLSLLLLSSLLGTPFAVAETSAVDGVPPAPEDTGSSFGAPYPVEGSGRGTSASSIQGDQFKKLMQRLGCASEAECFKKCSGDAQEECLRVAQEIGFSPSARNEGKDYSGPGNYHSQEYYRNVDLPPEALLDRALGKLYPEGPETFERKYGVDLSVACASEATQKTEIVERLLDDLSSLDLSQFCSDDEFDRFGKCSDPEAYCAKETQRHADKGNARVYISGTPSYFSVETGDTRESLKSKCLQAISGADEHKKNAEVDCRTEYLTHGKQFVHELCTPSRTPGEIDYCSPENLAKQKASCYNAGVEPSPGEGCRVDSDCGSGYYCKQETVCPECTRANPPCAAPCSTKGVCVNQGGFYPSPTAYPGGCFDSASRMHVREGSCGAYGRCKYGGWVPDSSCSSVSPYPSVTPYPSHYPTPSLVPGGSCTYWQGGTSRQVSSGSCADSSGPAMCKDGVWTEDCTKCGCGSTSGGTSGTCDPSSKRCTYSYPSPTPYASPSPGSPYCTITGSKSGSTVSINLYYQVPSVPSSPVTFTFTCGSQIKTVSASNTQSSGNIYSSFDTGCAAGTTLYAEGPSQSCSTIVYDSTYATPTPYSGNSISITDIKRTPSGATDVSGYAPAGSTVTASCGGRSASSGVVPSSGNFFIAFPSDTSTYCAYGSSVTITSGSQSSSSSSWRCESTYSCPGGPAGTYSPTPSPSGSSYCTVTSSRSSSGSTSVSIYYYLTTVPSTYPSFQVTCAGQSATAYAPTLASSGNAYWTFPSGCGTAAYVTVVSNSPSFSCSTYTHDSGGSTNTPTPSPSSGNFDASVVSVIASPTSIATGGSVTITATFNVMGATSPVSAQVVFSGGTSGSTQSWSDSFFATLNPGSNSMTRTYQYYNPGTYLPSVTVSAAGDYSAYNNVHYPSSSVSVGSSSSPTPSSCSSGYTSCSGSCVNLNYDWSNCGACGRSCSSGQYCNNGACTSSSSSPTPSYSPTPTTCASGATNCNGYCYNLNYDFSNCGSCGRACSPGQYCNNGVCASSSTPTPTHSPTPSPSGSSCSSDQTNCNGYCTNTRYDSSNCGSCGNACPSGQYCNNGACTSGSYSHAGYTSSLTGFAIASQLFGDAAREECLRGYEQTLRRCEESRSGRRENVRSPYELRQEDCPITEEKFVSSCVARQLEKRQQFNDADKEKICDLNAEKGLRMLSQMARPVTECNERVSEYCRFENERESKCVQVVSSGNLRSMVTQFVRKGCFEYSSQDQLKKITDIGNLQKIKIIATVPEEEISECRDILRREGAVVQDSHVITVSGTRVEVVYATIDANALENVRRATQTCAEEIRVNYAGIALEQHASSTRASAGLKAVAVALSAVSENLDDQSKEIVQAYQGQIVDAAEKKQKVEEDNKAKGVSDRVLTLLGQKREVIERERAQLSEARDKAQQAAERLRKLAESLQETNPTAAAELLAVAKDSEERARALDELVRIKAAQQEGLTALVKDPSLLLHLPEFIAG